jgi:hypothetical protein
LGLEAYFQFGSTRVDAAKMERELQSPISFNGVDRGEIFDEEA